MIRLSRHRSSSIVARGGHSGESIRGIRLLILRLLNGLDLVVYALVGLAFVGAAVLAFVFSVTHLLLHFEFALPLNDIAQDVLDFVSDLLLVLIIMELLGTIRSYVEKGDTSVEPFLIIGIISATRGILSIGARLYISGAKLTPDEFRNAMIELAINALVIIVLGFTMRILDGLIEPREDRHAPRHGASAKDQAPATLPPDAATPPQPLSSH
ncbi:MAG TPA: phosphate-starvation-inducible PsiE family protein [Ktedonobacterales bacterium]|nr:phosphate-starvation-inducible PsiE family protein [Ktedonobacterales bacterium]